MQVVKHSLLIASCAILVLASTGERAQAQGNPGVAISNEFDAKAAERARRKASPLALPDFAGPGAEPGGASLFKLQRVVLKGAHSIPQGTLAAIYAPYIGRKVSQADLARIAEAITAHYKAAGYALSRAFVPPQDIEDGRVVMQVAEGHVAEVVLEGPARDWFIARDILDPITRERPVRIATLERQMLLLSDLPGIQIKDAALKELGTGSGHFRLTVTAQFARALASVDLDNRGSPQSGPWQSFNTVALNAVLRPGDTLVVNGATAANDPRQLGYVGTIYEMPLGSDGARLGLRQTFSETWPSGIRRSYDFRTRTQDYAIYGAIVPLRSRATTIKLTAGAGVRAVEEVSRLGQSYEDHVTALSAGLDVQHQDSFSGTTVVSLSGRQGMSAFGATGASDLMTSRWGADSDFTKLSAVAVRYQALAGPVSLMLASGDLQGELNALSKQGGWAEMGERIDDEMLRTFAVVAEPDHVAAELLARFGDVVDRISFYTPYALDPEVLATIVEQLRAG